ncbi:MAG: dihydroneopterin aldolase [Sandaracinaceae bacterium]|nr:dihydroneopterin aldolase [Myxococcales bacterium]MCB9658155.1 dihydroneopterin aldolase [Sandaracinaceae bacterium]
MTPGTQLDTIRIRGLHVECVVGVYPHEREASQPLHVDLDLVLDTEVAAESERVRDTVHYAAAAAQVVFLLKSCHFRLLETAAHVIARYLLAPPSPDEQRALVQRVRVQLTKPGALRGFADPSVEIERSQGWATFVQEQKPWGTVDIIHETRDAGIYRLNIQPGGEIPLHVHRVMRESEMVLTSGLHCQRAPVPPGTVHRWPRGAAHVYHNPTERWQTILCVDSPAFIPEDECPVSGEPADVPPEPPWGPYAGVGG